MRSPLYALARGMDLLKALPESDTQAILAQARLRKVPEGSSVFAQGTPALRFYVPIEKQLMIARLSQKR